MGDEPPRRGFSWTAVFRAVGRSLLALPFAVTLLLAGAWMAWIWWLSSRRIDLGLDPENRLWPVVGNLAHAPLFGVLALLVAALVLRGQRRAPWPRVRAAHAAAVLGVALAWGIVDEWHQSRTAGRHSTWTDVVMDVAGAALVLWIVVYLGHDAADERGLRRRLWIGVGVCVVLALLTTRGMALP